MDIPDVHISIYGLPLPRVQRSPFSGTGGTWRIVSCEFDLYGSVFL